MEQVESEISRVLQDHHKISSSIRSEEEKIDALSREIGMLQDRFGALEMGDLERQRVQNLLSYQTTLIARAASRTELLRALHDDLLVLFLRRKQIREAGVDVVHNLSPSSALSMGNDSNDMIQNDCSMHASQEMVRMRDEQDNFQEVTTEQAELPMTLNMLQRNISEDAYLLPEDHGEFGEVHYKNDNILDDIAMSILNPDTNIVSLLEETLGNSDSPAEVQGSKRPYQKMEHVSYHNLERQLSVDFDEFGNPTGPNAGAFKRSINSYVCHYLPVRFKQIGDVPAEDYKHVLNVLTERYDFDINKSYTRKKISSCYRQHKYKLLVQVKKDLERGIEPQKPSYVKKEDWDVFVVKTRDDEFERISKKNKASRSHQGVASRKGSLSSFHKENLKELGKDLDCFAWEKMLKRKRGRPKEVPEVVNENGYDNVVNGMEFCIDEELDNYDIYSFD